MAAQTDGKSNSALGAFYRRLRSRLGTPKAITATAHNCAFADFAPVRGNYVLQGLSSSV